MLKSLTINNLLLIEKCHISFENGFSAVTGETGAGKTALIRSIDLCLGARADTQSIRNGALKATVTAEFECKFSPSFKNTLSEIGIPFDPKETFNIRREITSDGRSRCQINSTPCNVHDLQKVGEHLIAIVSQQENQSLKTSDAGREYLDLFAESSLFLKKYQTFWYEKQMLEKQLQDLESASGTRQRELDFAEFQLQEIIDAAVQEGEDEAIQAEHGKLSHSETATSKLQEINDLLDTLLPGLLRCKNAAQAIARHEPKIEELLQFFEQGRLYLTEASHLANVLMTDWEFDPKRLEYLDERLQVLHKIQSKYGKTFAEIQIHKLALQDKIATLVSLDENISECRLSLQKTEKQLTEAAEALSSHRLQFKEAAEKAITERLRELNMASASITIHHKAIPLNSMGKDHIELYLQASAGQKPCLLKDASGGELSRVLLSMRTALASNNQIPTIIFDEIDANVGGQTAVKIAEQMLQLSQDVQVICITHFPQVARYADHHLHVNKQEHDGITYAEVKALAAEEKEIEIARMLGV